MTMDLKTALEVVEELRRVWAATAERYPEPPATRNGEALAIVIAKARENLAAETVAKTHALVEQAREMSRPHAFRRPERREPTTPTMKHCDLCGALESDSIHALSARALEATRAHTFRPDSGPRRSLGCMLCGEHEFDPPHKEPGGTS